jgi:hypothetical protein
MAMLPGARTFDRCGAGFVMQDQRRVGARHYIYWQSAQILTIYLERCGVLWNNSKVESIIR